MKMTQLNKILKMFFVVLILLILLPKINAAVPGPGGETVTTTAKLPAEMESIDITALLEELSGHVPEKEKGEIELEIADERAREREAKRADAAHTTRTNSFWGELPGSVWVAANAPKTYFPYWVPWTWGRTFNEWSDRKLGPYLDAPDYFTAQLCYKQVGRKKNSNSAAFAPYEFGSFAFAQGEVILLQKEGQPTAYLYKISWRVNPGSCPNIRYNVVLKGSGSPSDYELYDPDFTQDNKEQGYLYIDKSSVRFDKVAIRFKDTAANCFDWSGAHELISPIVETTSDPSFECDSSYGGLFDLSSAASIMCHFMGGKGGPPPTPQQGSGVTPGGTGNARKLPT